MQGEFIDLEGLKNVLDSKENLYAYLDDAHGFSWYGENGAGYILGNHKKRHSKILTIVSMCKSFGCAGGVTVFENEKQREQIQFLGQTNIFSAPMANPVLGAAIASAKIHLSPQLQIYQKELNDLIIYFKKRCFEENVLVRTKSLTPIQFIEIGKTEQVMKIAEKMLQKGIFCSIAAYPAMPKNHAGLRVSLTRHLNFEDVDYFIDSFKLLHK